MYSVNLLWFYYFIRINENLISGFLIILKYYELSKAHSVTFIITHALKVTE